MAKKCPTLLEFLGLTVWPDGSDRETGTLSLFVEDSQWKAALNDRDGSCSAYVTAGTLTALLERLERGLVKDDLDWRGWKKGGVDKKKK